MVKTKKLEVPEKPHGKDRTTQEFVYSRLRHAIMIGAIEPGTNLTMRGLAEAMDLSPTPIREAVRRLSSENAIEILPNRRMCVPKMTLGRFEELVALRSVLEVHAAVRALPYISDIMIEKLKSLDDKMDLAVAAGDHDNLTVLNQEFHRALYSANPNQVSTPVIESVWLQLGPFQRQVVERVSEFYKVDRHKEILSALRTRDAAALAKASEGDVRDGIGRRGRQVLTTMAPNDQAA